MDTFSILAVCLQMKRYVLQNYFMTDNVCSLWKCVQKYTISEFTTNTVSSHPFVMSQ